MELGNKVYFRQVAWQNARPKAMGCFAHAVQKNGAAESAGCARRSGEGEQFVGEWPLCEVANTRGGLEKIAKPRVALAARWCGPRISWVELFLARPEPTNGYARPKSVAQFSERSFFSSASLSSACLITSICVFGKTYGALDPNSTQSAPISFTAWRIQ